MESPINIDPLDTQASFKYTHDLSDYDQALSIHEAVSNTGLYQSNPKSEICSIHPKMKKDHYCIDDHQHLCSRCIIEEHKNHKYEPLSKIASELVTEYQDMYSKFNDSIKHIKKIDAQNWKSELRMGVLDLFDKLFGVMDVVKKEKLTEINKIFADCDIQEVNKGFNDLQVSKNLALEHQTLLLKMFE